MTFLRVSLPSMPYRRAPYNRFSMGESFLKKLASTDTRFIIR